MIILMLSDISWSGLHQRPQHIALAFAKQWRVLWVQCATLGDSLRTRHDHVGMDLVTLTVPAIPYNARNKTIRGAAKFLGRIESVRSAVTALQHEAMRRTLRELAWENDPVVVFVHNYLLLRAARMLNPRLIHYDYIDNAFGFTKLPPHVGKEWERCVQTADSLSVTSPTLARQLRKFTAAYIHHVGNGVEYTRFASPSPVDRPDDLPEGKPVVLYVGAVYPWLDYDLLRTAFEKLPDFNFVFIGPVHPDIAHVVKRLRSYGNALFLGFRKYDTIPAYLHHAAAGIIPFRRNELTASVNPVKLYEYSAAGLPTVSTDFSDDLAPFRDLIAVATSAEEFVSRVQTAVMKRDNPDFREKLLAFAREHDWDRKTGALADILRRRISP